MLESICTNDSEQDRNIMAFNSYKQNKRKSFNINALWTYNQTDT